MLLLARTAEVQKPDRKLARVELQSLPSGGSVEERDGPPVAGKPSRVGGEQHQIGSDGTGEQVLLLLHLITALESGGDYQRGRAIELAPRSRLVLLGDLLEPSKRAGAEDSKAPRVGQVVVGSPARQLEQPFQHIRLDGLGREHLVRTPRLDRLLEIHAHSLARRAYVTAELRTDYEIRVKSCCPG